MHQRITILLTAVCAVGIAAVPSQEDFSLPAPADASASNLDLWATHYFVHTAAEVNSGVPLRDKTGKALTGNLSPKDWCLGAIEGTIQVTSKDTVKTLNFAGTGSTAQIDCAAVLKIDPNKKPWISSVGKSYFTAAVGPFGDGVAGFILVPYRTVAVDKNKIPYGTALFIPKAKGMEIIISPGVTIKHDGYFFAADTGGAIKGAHIDVFCGAMATNCFPSFIASDESQKFSATKVTDTALVSKLKALHKP